MQHGRGRQRGERKGGGAGALLVSGPSDRRVASACGKDASVERSGAGKAVGLAVLFAWDENPVRCAAGGGNASERSAEHRVNVGVAGVPVPAAVTDDDGRIAAQKRRVPGAARAGFEGKEGGEPRTPGFGRIGASGVGDGDLRNADGPPLAPNRALGPQDSGGPSVCAASTGGRGAIEGYFDSVLSAGSQDRVAAAV